MRISLESVVRVMDTRCFAPVEKEAQRRKYFAGENRVWSVDRLAGILGRGVRPYSHPVSVFGTQRGLKVIRTNIVSALERVSFVSIERATARRSEIDSAKIAR